MFLRSLQGYYAGQVREFPAPIGNELLRLGRAENPFAETQPRGVAQTVSAPRSTAAAKKKGAKK